MTDTPVLAVDRWPNNAALIADVARLGWLRKEDRCLDPTYGKGLWWADWRPDDLTTKHRPKDRSDFRKLKFPDGHFDSIAFDPPYVCVDLSTEILTRWGWATWAEVRTGTEVYTLNHATGLAEWKPVEDVHILPAQRRQMLSVERKDFSSLSTLDHRWPVLRSGKRDWTTSGEFKPNDQIIRAAASADLPLDPILPDALVELIAWFWTEGHIEGVATAEGGDGGYGHICQSHVVNPDNCARIGAAFEALYGPPVDKFPRLGRKTSGPMWRLKVEDRNIRFIFSADVGRQLLQFAPVKIPSFNFIHSLTADQLDLFIHSLTADQLDLFIDVSILADGHTRPGVRGPNRRLGQKHRSMAEAFQLACTLRGISTTINLRDDQWVVQLRNTSTVRPLRNPVEIVEYDGPVWCVTIENSSWLARRNGTVYFTGNCKGGRATSGIREMDDRYGQHDAPATPKLLQALINDGLTEMTRLTAPGGIILVRCKDYISSGDLFEGTYFTRRHAESLGLHGCERFEYVGAGGPQPPGRRQVHARRNNSTLFVFRKGKSKVRCEPRGGQ